MTFKLFTRRRHIWFKTCIAFTVTLVLGLWFLVLKKTGERNIIEDLQKPSALNQGSHNAHVKYRKTVLQGWLYMIAMPKSNSQLKIR